MRRSVCPPIIPLPETTGAPEIGRSLTPALREQAIEALSHVHGAECAAWLVWTHHRRMTCGMLQFNMPLGHEIPPWFLVAIYFLEHRKGWKVRRYIDTQHATQFVIHWIRRNPS